MPTHPLRAPDRKNFIAGKSCHNQAFVLRLVFVQRINADLDLFCSAWDNHPIRTANNGTPDQLFIIGQLSYDPNSNIPEIVTDSYGIDFECPASSRKSN